MAEGGDSLRKDGRLPVISIEADTLADATYQAIILCHDRGARVETPKHKPGGTLGYDANMIIRVRHPDSEPKICDAGMSEDPRGIMQYILEVTHGIHNHWKKSPEHPDRWGYTYNERFVDQLPFVFQRIKADWDKQKRITGRDYQFAMWRAGEDIILEQEDPPCWQLGQLRFLTDYKGELVMDYQTNWRSRDLAKAWNENNIAQVELMKLFKDKVSSMLGVPIKLGAYTDHSDSLHLYGFYFDRDNLGTQIRRMWTTPCREMSRGLEEYLEEDGGKARLKRLVAAQSDAEAKGHGLNVSEELLENLGYNLNTFKYPADWDSWPKSWDAVPDPSKLARIP